MNTSCPHPRDKALFVLLAAVALILLFSRLEARDKNQVKAVVKEELNILKSIGSGEASLAADQQSFLKALEEAAGEQAFSPQSSSLSALKKALPQSEGWEVFQRFYRDFDYRILNIRLNKDSRTALVKVSLNTLDARILARDLKAEELRREILRSSLDNSTQNPAEDTIKDSGNYSIEDSMKDRLDILLTLLEENKYKVTDSRCDIRCMKEKEGWRIIHTLALENELSGGFLSALTDPELLSPEEVCEINLEALKEMDPQKAISFLDTSLNTEDPEEDVTKDRVRTAQVLAEEYLSSLEYHVFKAEIKGYRALVPVQITTFDEDTVLSAYQASLDEYLHSAAAVIDGEEKRGKMSRELLMDAVQNCKETKTSEKTFFLYNDGTAWKLFNP